MPAASLNEYVKFFLQRWRIGLVLACVALVYCYRLDKPALWCDEADTGIFARNLLRTGQPVAYDSRNVTMFNNGGQLSKNLVSKKIPWVQYYLGAASITIFGDTTAGLRYLFPLIGLMAFFPIYAVLKPRVPMPDVVTGLVLLAPQIVMFQRNARYYSILILLYAVLIWLLTVKLKSKRSQAAVATVVLILLFHTHPIAAISGVISLLVYCTAFQRDSLLVYGFASAVGFLSWLAWYSLLGPSLSKNVYAISTITEDFGGWLSSFLGGFGAAIFDLDVVDCFPILFVVGLSCVLIWRDRRTFFDFFKQPLAAMVLINLLVEALLTATIFGSEWETKMSLLRYEPHLLVFGLVFCIVLLGLVVRYRIAFIACCALLVATNVLNVSYWLKPSVRDVPASWALPVYLEVFQAQVSAWDDVVGMLRNEAAKSSKRDEVIVASPQWTQEILLYYVGDLYIVPPIFDPPCIPCQQAIVRIMGQEALLRMAAKPTWWISMFGPAETPPADTHVAATLSAYTLRPDQGSRPELTQHTFHEADAVGSVTIYRQQQLPKSNSPGDSK